MREVRTRVLGRGWPAAGLACLALLAAGCGQPTANSQVIGVRPVPHQTPSAAQLDAAAIAATMSEELAAANATQAIPAEDLLALGELPIDSTLTLKQLEQLGGLQQLGQIIIQNRLTVIASLRSQVVANKHMATTDRWNITYLLDAAAARLRAMRVKITKDLLVDQARADVTNVAAFRVYGLLVPQVHMLIAAYELRQLLSDYTAEEHSLEQQINSAVLGANVGGARAALNDMLAQLPVMDQTSRSALYLLQGLSSSGYPGNKQRLRMANSYLDRGQAASKRAANDALAAKTALLLT